VVKLFLRVCSCASPVGGQSQRGLDGSEVRQKLRHLRFKSTIRWVDIVASCHFQTPPPYDSRLLQDFLPLRSALTRGHSALTRVRSALTRGHSALTRVRSALTRGHSALTRVRSALTRGHSALTRGRRA
jgi:hypothetical protein